MPLPTDEKLLALVNDLLQRFDQIFSLNPGFRPAHAKGTILKGVFTPAPAAASLSRAPHFTRSSTPVSVRFSNSTGVPLIPDNDPNADPRGLAIRFHLAERVHTDIVSHSTDGFPTHTGAEFLEFLTALASTTPDARTQIPSRHFLEATPPRWPLFRRPNRLPQALRAKLITGLQRCAFSTPKAPAATGDTEFFRKPETTI